MHKYIILFFSVLAFLTACGGNNAPEGILPPPQMVAVLTDIHLTDGSLYSVPQVPDSLYKYGTARYAALFKKHKTTPKVFSESLKYYTTKPPQFLEMYDQVSKNIQAKIDLLNKRSKPVTTNPKAPNAVPVK